MRECSLGLPFQLERRQQTDVLSGKCWDEKESRPVRAEQFQVCSRRGEPAQRPRGHCTGVHEAPKEASVTGVGGAGREWEEGSKWTRNVIPSSVFVREHPTCRLLSM